MTSKNSTSGTRSIFNTEAIERYNKRQQKMTLPRFISPSVFTGLWLLLILFGIALAAAWRAEVPIMASGTAVVTQDTKTQAPILVAFLPANYADQIEAGQTLHLTVGQQHQSIIISNANTSITSPEDAQSLYNLTSGTAVAITQPSVIVTAPFQPASAERTATDYLGSIYAVDVEVGSHRLASLLPVFGRILENQH